MKRGSVERLAHGRAKEPVVEPLQYGLSQLEVAAVEAIGGTDKLFDEVPIVVVNVVVVVVVVVMA